MIDPDDRHASRPTHPVAIALAVSVALAYSTQSGVWMRSLVGPGTLPEIPYLRSVLTSLSDVLVMLVLAMIAARRGPRAILALSGLGAPCRQPLRWALLIFAPALLLCLAVAPIATGLRAADLLWLALGGPITEELVFRGLAIGLLMRLGGWRWLPACLWPAFFFALAHIWQGSGLLDTLGVAGITAAGGLLFGWLFVRWGFNLWPPILLHVGLNSLWLIFDLGDNAIGGWFGNALRLAVVAAAIVATFRLAPPPRRTLPPSPPDLAPEGGGRPR